MKSEKRADGPELEQLQRESFSYFLNEANPTNGLVIDKTADGSPASIAATGFALVAYPIPFVDSRSRAVVLEPAEDSFTCLAGRRE